MHVFARMVVVVSVAAVFAPAIIGCQKKERSRSREGSPHGRAERQLVGAKRAAKSPDSGPAERVEIETSDGVTIVGTLHRAGVPGPAVLLVHQLDTSHAEWEPLVQRLTKSPGMTTLTIDMRGHGESTRSKNGRTLEWRSFRDGDWPKLSADVIAAVDLLSQNRLGSVEPAQPGATSVIAIGSSIGSSAVLQAAERDSRIKAVVALSPGRAYKGIDALTPTSHLDQRRLLAVATENDAHSAETAREMGRIAQHGRAIVVAGSAHGVRMLEEQPTLLDEVERFVRARAE